MVECKMTKRKYVTFITVFLTSLFDETINREIYFQNSSFLTLNITKSYLSFLLLDLAKVIHAVHLHQECVDMIHRLKKCLEDTWNTDMKCVIVSMQQWKCTYTYNWFWEKYNTFIRNLMRSRVRACVGVIVTHENFPKLLKVSLVKQSSLLSRKWFIGQMKYPLSRNKTHPVEKSDST